MFKLKKQIEGQIQEIVFFFSLMIGFSIFFSGIFYLMLSAETLSYIIGRFGVMVEGGLFTLLGYSYFYLSVMTLHMGYVTNFHVFNFRDLKRQYPILLCSLLAHLTILLLFANMLSVIQLSLEISPSASLTRGSGGLLGLLFSGALYSNVGVYGSLISLFALMGVTALLGGFFEIPDVVVAVKAASHTTKKGFQFLARAEEMPELSTAAGMGGAHARNWISNSWNKANHMMTDQFHIYKKEDSKKEEAKKVDAKKVEVKKLEENPVLKKEINKVVGSILLVKEEKKELPPKKELKMEEKKEVRPSVSKASLATAQRLLDSFKELRKITVVKATPKTKAPTKKKTAAKVAVKTTLKKSKKK